MKVLVVWLFCAVTGAWAASQQTGTSVAWPGGAKKARLLVASIIPGRTKTTAFSTSQYINALPISGLTGFGPGFGSQFGYEPQISHFSPFQPSYYPISGGSIFGDGSYYPGSGSLFPGSGSYYPGGGAFFPPGGAVFPGDGSYYPGGGVVYPGAPISPIGPGAPDQPFADVPSYPSEQPGGDSDTTVVDSAEFPPEKQAEQIGADSENKLPGSQPTPDTLPTYPQPPQGTGTQPVQQPSEDNNGSATFPQEDQSNQSGNSEQASYPQIPQDQQQYPQNPQFPQIQQPQYPQIPQFPQYPQGLPGFPSYPSNIFPQLPSPSPPTSLQPQYPTNQQFANPSAAPPTSFPSADNTNKGADDEDTISVDSA